MNVLVIEKKVLFLLIFVELFFMVGEVIIYNCGIYFVFKGMFFKWWLVIFVKDVFGSYCLVIVFVDEYDIGKVVFV